MSAWIIFYNVTSEYNSAFVFLKLGFQLRVLEMTDVHQWREVNGFAFFPGFTDHLIFVSDFCQLSCRYFLEFFSFFVHCCFRIWYFHCFRHKNKLVHEIAVVHWVDSFPRKVVFMIFMQSSFQTLSQRFVGFNDACVLCLASIRSTTSFVVRSSPDLARHCCWHRNFQLSSRIFNSFFELRIRWISEVNTAQSSGVVKLRFFW